MRIEGYVNTVNGSLGLMGDKYISPFTCKELAVRGSSRRKLAFIHEQRDKLAVKMKEYINLIDKTICFEPIDIQGSRYDALAITKRASYLQKEIAAVLFRAFQRNPSLLSEPVDLNKALRTSYCRNPNTKLILKNFALFKRVANKAELKRCNFSGDNYSAGLVDWTRYELGQSIDNLKREIEKQKLTKPKKKVK